jgi:hypothetical protein
MDIETLERRERESRLNAASASSDEARIAHEGLAQGYADRLFEKVGPKIASATPLKVMPVNGNVQIAIPGQADALLTPEAASKTADSLLSQARQAGHQGPH